MKKFFYTFILLFLISLLFGNKNIMLTGYWNPTGQMISKFSTDPELNPAGWSGENWNNSGFDVYSFFPKPGEYTGDFEVDYQDTRTDFFEKVTELNPIAIISFGAGDGPWEIEYRARNLDQWVNDYEAPFQPVPSPPDSTISAGAYRYSTLPMDEISAVVNDSTDIYSWIDWNGNPGAFLCEFIAYLGMWYQDRQDNFAENPCVSSGFIHVNNTVSTEDATIATDLTLNETINYLKTFRTINTEIICNDIEINDLKLSITGKRNYFFDFGNETDIEIPLIPDDNYDFSAINYESDDSYYFGMENYFVDSLNTDFSIEMTKLFYRYLFSYHGEAYDMLSFSNSDSKIAAIRLTEDELVEENENLIGKICFKAPANSDSSQISVKVFETESGIEPENADLIYSKKVTQAFVEGDLVEHIPVTSLKIDNSKDYWVGYDISAENGNIAYVDEGTTLSGKGAWLYLGFWSEVDEVTSKEGNFLIDVGFYSEEETAVEENIISFKDRINLRNYPNPFSGSEFRGNGLNIEFTLEEESFVNLSIFNIKGQKVTELINSNLDKKNNNILWNPRKKIASGVYFYKIQVDGKSAINKILYLR